MAVAAVRIIVELYIRAGMVKCVAHTYRKLHTVKSRKKGRKHERHEN